MIFQLFLCGDPLPFSLMVSAGVLLIISLIIKAVRSNIISSVLMSILIGTLVGVGFMVNEADYFGEVYMRGKWDIVTHDEYWGYKDSYPTRERRSFELSNAFTLGVPASIGSFVIISLIGYFFRPKEKGNKLLSHNKKTYLQSFWELNKDKHIPIERMYILGKEEFSSKNIAISEEEFMRFMETKVINHG